MKHILFTILMLAWVGCLAQNKFDFNSRMKLHEMKQPRKAVKAKDNSNPVTSIPDSDPLLTAFVELDPSVSEDIFEGMGVETISKRGDIAIVRTSADILEALSLLPQVKSIALDRPLRPMMHEARKVTDVDNVHKGIPGLTESGYKGNGVITGIYDTGFDAQHINFKNDDGSSRIKLLCHYENAWNENIYSTPEEIETFITDSEDTWHGTETLGIMAGGYKGPGNYSVYGGSVIQQNYPNSSIPFYGVAPESDIALACGPLFNSSTLRGVAKIVDFAKEEGKPCVINLSIGDYYGPHDGTDYFSKYLAALGRDAIICISSGNEGDVPCTFVVNGKTFKTLMVSNTFLPALQTTIDIWSSDRKPFRVHFIAIDANRKELFRYTLVENTEGKMRDISKTDDFNNYFNGKAYISSNVDQGNQRYNVGLSLDITSRSKDVYAGLIIEPADESQKINGYADTGVAFISGGFDGFSAGDSDNSINGLACGDNVIVVGAYVSSKLFNNYLGNTFGVGGSDDVGDICDFSSYGPTFSGRQLPDVCAPGKVIQTSFSRFAIEKGYIPRNLLSGTYVSLVPQGGMNSWSYASGTSMSAPMVSGIVALWLQADPTLTVDDVREIIQLTSTNDAFTEIRPERWGAGKINAEAGLKMVLDRMAENGVSTLTSGPLSIRVNPGDIHIESLSTSNLTARLLDLSGKLIAMKSGCGALTLDSSALAKGVYLLEVSGQGVRELKKILLP